MIDTPAQGAAARNGAGPSPDPQETAEWLDALEGLIEAEGGARAREVVNALLERAQTRGVEFGHPLTTPYINTIPLERQPAFPGNARDRRAPPALYPLERDGDGRARQHARRPSSAAT